MFEMKHTGEDQRDDCPEEQETTLIEFPHMGQIGNGMASNLLGCEGIEAARGRGASVDTYDEDKEDSRTEPENGALLVTVRSKWRCPGREVFSQMMPVEFHHSQLQITIQDYQEVIARIMASPRLRYHPFIYSTPNMTAFLSSVLVGCLIVAPITENRALPHGNSLGFEFIHAMLFWMMLVFVYLLTAYCLKHRADKKFEYCIKECNAILARSNILCFVEELGMVELSKLNLHFFYYEFGRCLAFTQDLLYPETEQLGGEGEQSNFGASAMMSTNMDMNFEDTTVLNMNSDDHVNVEELLYNNMNHYFHALLNGRMRNPVCHRHVLNYACLCQYIEQELFKRGIIR